MSEKEDLKKFKKLEKRMLKEADWKVKDAKDRRKTITKKVKAASKGMGSSKDSFLKTMEEMSDRSEKEKIKQAEKLRNQAKHLRRGRRAYQTYTGVTSAYKGIKSAIGSASRVGPAGVAAAALLTPTAANVGEDAAVKKMHRDYKKMSPSTFKREYGRKTIGKTSPKKKKAIGGPVGYSQRWKTGREG